MVASITGLAGHVDGAHIERVGRVSKTALAIEHGSDFDLAREPLSGRHAQVCVCCNAGACGIAAGRICRQTKQKKPGQCFGLVGRVVFHHTGADRLYGKVVAIPPEPRALTDESYGLNRSAFGHKRTLSAFGFRGVIFHFDSNSCILFVRTLFN